MEVEPEAKENHGCRQARERIWYGLGACLMPHGRDAGVALEEHTLDRFTGDVPTAIDVLV